MIMFKKCVRVTADRNGLNIFVNGCMFRNHSYMHIHKNAPEPIAIYYRKIPAGRRKLENVKVMMLFPFMKLKLGLKYKKGKKYVDLYVKNDGVRTIHNGKHINEIPFKDSCIIL